MWRERGIWEKAYPLEMMLYNIQRKKYIHTKYTINKNGSRNKWK